MATAVVFTWSCDAIQTLEGIIFWHIFVFLRNESDEGDDPEKKKFQNQLSGLKFPCFELI